VPVRDVEDVGRLAETGDPATQGPHQRLTLGDRHPEMAGARREIAVVQVVGLDPRLDEGPHQPGERRGVIIDPAQQHRLAEHRNPGVDDPGAGGPGRGRQLTRVIGVQGDIDGPAPALQRRDQVAAGRR